MLADLQISVKAKNLYLSSRAAIEQDLIMTEASEITDADVQIRAPAMRPYLAISQGYQSRPRKRTSGVRG